MGWCSENFRSSLMELFTFAVSHCLNGIYNLYSERNPLSLDP